jgi:hypothetical protein
VVLSRRPSTFLLVLSLELAPFPSTFLKDKHAAAPSFQNTQLKSNSSTQQRQHWPCLHLCSSILVNCASSSSEFCPSDLFAQSKSEATLQRTSSFPPLLQTFCFNRKHESFSYDVHTAILLIRIVPSSAFTLLLFLAASASYNYVSTLRLIYTQHIPSPASPPAPPSAPPLPP